MLTFGSLFAGIGGFDLGLERAGMVCKWQVEINPFCQKVLAKHWPAVTRYSDVKQVGKHNLAQVDVICGGFPCQDISQLGNRMGLNGERSSLWLEFRRVVSELRPKYAVVENVSDLLVRGMGEVLGGLAEIGYDAEWQILPAAAFGLPHQRERVFIIAYPSRAGQGLGWYAQRREIKRVDWQGLLSSDRSRTDNGLSHRVDRNIAIGNAVVPQIAEHIGRLIMSAASQ